MKKALILGSAALATLALPLVSLAAINNISDLGSFIIDTINGVIVPVLFAVAFIVFLWGAFKVFILGASNEEAKKKGSGLMMYSLIGFFVMIAIWGLVNLLVNTIGFGDKSGPSGVPQTGVQIGG